MTNFYEMQVREFTCGSFVVGLSSSHALTESPTAWAPASSSTALLWFQNCQLVAGPFR